jgi:hypothetical protein
MSCIHTFNLYVVLYSTYTVYSTSYYYIHVLCFRMDLLVMSRMNVIDTVDVLVYSTTIYVQRTRDMLYTRKQLQYKVNED